MASNPDIAGPGQTNSVQRKVPSTTDWDRHRETISNLYLDNKLKLKEVVAIMEGRYNFTATARMYKKRFNEWGFNKNLKTQEMVALVRKVQSESLAGNSSPAAVELDGKIVPRSKIDRFARRHRQDLAKTRSSSVATSENSENSPPSITMDSWIKVNVSGDGRVIEKDIEADEAGEVAREAPGTTSRRTSSSKQIDPRLFNIGSLPRILSRSITGQPIVGSPLQDILSVTDLDMTDAGLLDASISPGWQLVERRAEQRVKQPLQPVPRNRALPKVVNNATFNQSLLLTLVLSAVSSGLPLAVLSVARLEAFYNEASFNTRLLGMVVNLVSELQLEGVVIMLAIIYLCRFNASQFVQQSDNVWLQFVVALRFAHLYIHDEHYAAEAWSTILRRQGVDSSAQGSFEGRILSDKFIILHPHFTERTKIEAELHEISELLLVIFDRDKSKSENTSS